MVRRSTWSRGVIDEQGARAKLAEQRVGWHYAPVIERGHFCFPPRTYPQQVGAGSLWCCETCRAVWYADGIQLLDGSPSGYPAGDGIGRSNRALMSPLRWLLRQQSPRDGYEKDQEQIDTEHRLYDFRPISGYWVKLWRLQLETMGADWRTVTD